jgi:hypothetical protein
MAVVFRVLDEVARQTAERLDGEPCPTAIQVDLQLEPDGDGTRRIGARIRVVPAGHDRPDDEIGGYL